MCHFNIALASCYFMFFLHCHQLLCSEVYDYDVTVNYPTGHAKAGEPLLLRGRFPDLSALTNPVEYQFRPVAGSFKNLTSIDIPIQVSTLLSYGPKFMLPSYTLMSPAAQADEFVDILDVLEAAGYCHERRHRLLREPLENVHSSHVGGNQPIKSKDRQLLHMALQTDQFLAKHRKNYMVSEGDKGKVVCLIARSQFSSLCESYLNGGIISGQFVNYKR